MRDTCAYTNGQGAWSQLGADLDGEAAHDQLGRSIAMSADGLTVAAGAITNDGTGSDARTRTRVPVV